ncbi:urease accessory protein UreD [Sulfoacidibacillus thermotolerans]|uniref:Urease accessory protein UreD n=1 Tax=Sulfoacidibacillus thermotolerans TaxID=1765684 RepID=A0A2U3DC70_SULT2|nr:urease accessory protein UreD [Sulfoacidibacillus thermotolerans]PWI58883.1 hypothetical protein BM613_02015 [Sulfoacidibacillus thermotolerans]
MNGRWEGAVVNREGRTRLIVSKQQAPLKVAKPFERADGGLILYLMDASPGLFGGDTQRIVCSVKSGAKLYLTNQASAKLHPSPSLQPSRQMQSFYVAQDAVFEYMPEPVVPFAGSLFEGETQVYMTSGATAMVGEILTPGRVGKGEVFCFERYESRFIVYWEQQCVVWDAILLEPRRESLFVSSSFGSFTHVGTFYALSERVANTHVATLQALLNQFSEDDVYGGCSALSKNGLVVRILGRSAWRVAQVMHACHTRMRQLLLGADELLIRK